MNLYDGIAKRHDGDAWVVMTELANGTGSSVSRHADAVALGLWPSRGHSVIGYEVKHSRSDVQKELADPRKADAVGKYCDEWWLVVSDLKIIDGLIIPETWGILYPKNLVLRAHRKAPKLTPRPVDRGFVAAMIRNVTKSWVPRAKHNELREQMDQRVKAEAARHAETSRESAELELERLKRRVADFEAASGVKISDHWNMGQLGEAVKLALDLRGHTGLDSVKRSAGAIEQAAYQHEHLAANARAAAANLRALLTWEETTARQRDLFENLETSLVDEGQNPRRTG